MCGIYGIIFKNCGQQRESIKSAGLFSALAAESAIRGTDSSGLCRVQNDGYYYIYKNIVPSYEIVKYKRWWRPLYQTNKNTIGLLGHTRLATHGANVLENAHPFGFQSDHSMIVGTHNGVIRNHESLHSFKDKHVNDSANLFIGLAETPKAQWAKFLESVDGSFALAWTDTEHMYLARNSGNPIVIIELEELDAYVYASTEFILQEALKATKMSFDKDKIKMLADDRIFQFNMGGAYDEIRFTPKSTYGYHGWYGSCDPWQGETRVNWNRSDTGKFLPRTKNVMTEETSDDDLEVCVQCGHEVNPDRMTFDVGLNGKVCNECVYTNPKKVKCDWCTQNVRFLRFDNRSQKYLCNQCYDYTHNQVTAHTEQKCDWCNKQGFLKYNDISGKYLCKDCMDEDDTMTLNQHNQLIVLCDTCGDEFPAEEVNSKVYWNASEKRFICEGCLEELRDGLSVSNMGATA